LVGTAACLAWVVMREAARTAQGSARLAQGLLLAVVPLVLAYRVADRLADRVDPAESVARNFFGTLKLRDTGTGDGAYRALYHGGTEHGGQYAAAALRSTPTSYYAKESGVGQALLAVQAGKPVKVGVIGLGTGTIAAYSRAGDEFRFYDINPLVVDIARSKFAYLEEARGRTAVVMGDARVSLEHEPVQRFDALVVDAFSGDSIPIHLLTAEAFSEYFRHLSPHGVLAVHTSTRYLDLNPVVKAAADAFGKDLVLVENDRDAARRVNSSSWVLVADRGSPALDQLRPQVTPSEQGWPKVRLWTDDYSSVVTAMKALKRAPDE
jgi:spermidine synthase